MIMYWMVFGLIAGILAYILDDREDKGGLLGSVLVGVVGAVIGGNMATLVMGGVKAVDIQSLMVVGLGALALLSIRRIVY